MISHGFVSLVMYVKGQFLREGSQTFQMPVIEVTKFKVRASVLSISEYGSRRLQAV